MSRIIWKFDISADARQVLYMPKGAEVLCVQRQGPTPKLWALCDPDAPANEPRTFALYGTGHLINDPQFEQASMVSSAAPKAWYIGTFQLHDGQLVFHLFEVAS